MQVNSINVRNIVVNTKNKVERSEHNNFADTLLNCAVKYSVNSTNRDMEIRKAITKDSIVLEDFENFSKWQKYFKEKGLEYEEILSDDGLKNIANEQESETKTNIVVKPDGSRVLVVTMNIGGMETTMSLEIAKPTNELNDTKNKNVSIHKQVANNAADLSKHLGSDTSI